MGNASDEDLKAMREQVMAATKVQGIRGVRGVQGVQGVRGVPEQAMAATKIQAIMRGKQARSNPSGPTRGTEDNVPESTPPAPAQGLWTLSEVGEALNAVDSGASWLSYETS